MTSKSVKPFAVLTRTSGALRLFAHGFAIIAQTPLHTGRRLRKAPMVRVLIRSGIYRSSPSKEIQLSTVTWLVDKRSFEFTMSISDGFYETWLTPSVEIKQLSFSGGVAEIFIKSERDIGALAEELISMDKRCSENCSNIRM